VRQENIHTDNDTTVAFHTLSDVTCSQYS